MDVHIAPAQEAQLAELAAKTGRNTDELVQEALERFIASSKSYDEWFIREVEKGLAAADRGEFVEHDKVGEFIQSRYRR
jgi:predicted transcriptional regulator